MITSCTEIRCLQMGSSAALQCSTTSNSSPIAAGQVREIIPDVISLVAIPVTVSVFFGSNSPIHLLLLLRIRSSTVKLSLPAGDFYSQAPPRVVVHFLLCFCPCFCFRFRTSRRLYFLFFISFCFASVSFLFFVSAVFYAARRRFDCL